MNEAQARVSPALACASGIDRPCPPRRCIRCPRRQREGGMAEARRIDVHLMPDLATPARLAGGLAVVVDVLRATTTIVHALAAGCVGVRPCGEVEEARALADSLPAGKVLL